MVGLTRLPIATADQISTLRPLILARMDHDPSAYTEGMFLDSAAGAPVLYESTGLVGQSELREVDPDSGQVRRTVPLPPTYFGEGIADAGAHLWQLTYENGVAIEWDKPTLTVVREVPLHGQGWGLCRAGDHLIRSDGSPVLHLHAVDDMHETGTMTVTYNGIQLSGLNGLDCVGNQIWANVFPTDQMVQIDATTGAVRAVVYADGLLDPAQRRDAGVLNGIAHLGGAISDGQFLITGKNWPTMFRVRFDSA
ncbi:glutaminyl-peptide cyclotransferase [Mycobacterium sp. CBMA 234]|nr:glutaminyl-peptide cyclotransferase [Mycolicibacterium sp. CBMA 234]